MKRTWITSKAANHLALLNTFGAKEAAVDSAKLQEIYSDSFEEKNLRVFLKREDVLHPKISGNKYRKLKYNLLEATRLGHKTILSFGGAFSNHIHALALAGKYQNLSTIGVIRGDELKTSWSDNPTLSAAQEAGMKFKFVSRIAYREKDSPSFLKELQSEFGSFYVLPEGGTNPLAIKGCQEILTESDRDFDYICCSVGTGGTLAGLINASAPDQKIYGFPALKGDFLKKDIRKFTTQENWDLQTSYHFGGYAKFTDTLISFMNRFKREHGILLDPVYTAKMMYGILDLIEKDYFKTHSRILAIHTGGLQGIAGMNQRLKMKNLPLIEL